MTNKKKKMFYNYSIRSKGGFADTMLLSSLLLFIGYLIVLLIGGIE